MLGKTYKPVAIKLEAKEEEPSSSLPVVPSADEIGTKEEEAAASYPSLLPAKPTKLLPLRWRVCPFRKKPIAG